MGTREEEAAAMDRIQQEAIKREVERMQAEAARKAAEEAAKKAAEQQGKMVADPGAGGMAWPDDEAAVPAQSGRDKITGALGVGHAGDVAFARNLLSSGQPPLSGAVKPETATDGAKERASGARSANPALGLG
jgi:hypothetical protein